MAFLVSLVPGPIKYQRSFEGGVMTPFFEGLVATLLAKLRSVDALTEEEYAAALRRHREPARRAGLVHSRRRRSPCRVSSR